MGASGTWHLGLKHPDRFVALGPYCGYVDTHEFSKTPLPNFVVVGPLPPHQEKTLHMLDSVDYAANAGIGPGRRLHGREGRLLPGPRDHGPGDGDGRASRWST